MLRAGRRGLQMVLRLLAHNAEHWLSNHLNAYLRDDDEYRAITRQTIIRGLASTITSTPGITITLETPSAPRVARAPSTYNAARKRPPSARARGDAALLAEIKRVYKDSGEVYGARKVWLQLHREGIPAARCTVERLMRQAGLAGVRRGRRKRTTIPADRAAWPPDLVNRCFRVAAPDRLWAVDLTDVPLAPGGFAYVAFVIDAFSRLIAGWKAAGHMRASLALDALEMAVSARLRAGQSVAGVVHHIDRGSPGSARRAQWGLPRGRRVRGVRRGPAPGAGQAGGPPFPAATVSVPGARGRGRVRRR